MSSRFATDTAVEPLGNGRYTATVDPGWWIVRGPNGGYIAAMLLRAVTAETGDPDRRPRSLTIHYTRPPEVGPVELAVTTERTGRTLSTLTVRMTQQGRLVAVGIAAVAASRPGPTFTDLPRPDAPVADDLAPAPGGPVDIPMRDRYDMRLVLGPPPGSPSSGGEAVTGGWIRLRDPEPVDEHVVAALTDAWFPAVFTLAIEPLAVPTIDLTVHFRDVPPLTAEWCFARFRTRHASEGYLEEDGEIWSADGRLLAQSRQLAVAMPMPG